ncbi:hypothetical protein VDIAB_10163 [Vibrio diabolicus]|nr:hypothetical protein VDIAB_10163 [Vibrio diabolicus]
MRGRWPLISKAFHQKALCEKASQIIPKQPKSRFSISIDVALFLRKYEGASTVAGQKQQLQNTYQLKGFDL